MANDTRGINHDRGRTRTPGGEAVFSWKGGCVTGRTRAGSRRAGAVYEIPSGAAPADHAADASAASAAVALAIREVQSA